MLISLGFKYLQVSNKFNSLIKWSIVVLLVFCVGSAPEDLSLFGFSVQFQASPGRDARVRNRSVKKIKLKNRLVCIRIINIYQIQSYWEKRFLNDQVPAKCVLNYINDLKGHRRMYKSHNSSSLWCVWCCITSPPDESYIVSLNLYPSVCSEF